MFVYTLGDPDYFSPLERTLCVDDPATRFSATGMPESWSNNSRNVWVQWTPPGCVLPGQGWKVHVAARLDQARTVLEIVARVCREERVAFKHLASERIFIWMHHKHGPRSQSGKFCAIYPITVDAARNLMERLSKELDGFEGAYPLTNRRFPDSRVVSYRYGGFTHPPQVQPDGSYQPMLVDGTGTAVPDARPTRFVLPDGIEDPFHEDSDELADGPVSFGGYSFTTVLRHANGGGAYEAKNGAGRTVFIKEARGNNGYHWDRSTAVERLRNEHAVLEKLHAAIPGICPEPLDYFTYWEHEFLATEFIAGLSLWSWMVLNNPLITVNPSDEVVATYFATCERIVDELRTQLWRIHDAGYCFGDLNPHNVLLVDGHPRLIDFEAAGPIDGKRHAIGADGYRPADAKKLDGRYTDEFALSAIAQMLISPVHPVLTRNPDAAEHLLADASQIGHVSPTLWAIASRYRTRSTRPQLPTPDEVAEDPTGHLTRLRDATVAGLLAMAYERTKYPDDPPFPTSTWGWATNRLCVAHGTAGVLHALRVAGEPIDPDLVTDLRRGALADRDLPPGLLTGLAGIAWVLADLGHLDEAADLLDTAMEHPIIAENATFGEGVAGVAAANLALYGHTGDDRRLAKANELLAALLPDVTALLGPRQATGWQRGRVGIALALFYAGELCGEETLQRHGLRLLREELDRAEPGDAGGLLYRVSASDRRIEPYLATGSAGFAVVADRYLTRFGDEALAAARRESLRSCAVPMSVSAGLFNGTAGLGFALADHGHRGSPGHLAEAYGVGRGMFKYAVPFGEGRVRYLSGIDTRYRADLAGGSAGILLFVTKLLTDVPDPIFTLDGLLATVRTTQLAARQPA